MSIYTITKTLRHIGLFHRSKGPTYQGVVLDQGPVDDCNRHHLVKICALEELHWLYNCDPLVTVSDLGAVWQISEISSKCSSLTSPTCIEKEAYRVFIYCTSSCSISKRADYTNILSKIPSLSDWEYYIPTVGTSKHTSMHSPKICHGWVLINAWNIIFGPAFLVLGPKQWMGGQGNMGNLAPIWYTCMGIQQPKINLKYISLRTHQYKYNFTDCTNCIFDSFSSYWVNCIWCFLVVTEINCINGQYSLIIATGCLWKSLASIKPLSALCPLDHATQDDNRSKILDISIWEIEAIFTTRKEPQNHTHPQLQTPVCKNQRCSSNWNMPLILQCTTLLQHSIEPMLEDAHQHLVPILDILLANW